jgi:hypothetical protein
VICGRAARDRFVHFLDGNRLPRGFHDSPQSTNRELRQQYDATVGVHEKLDAIAGF